MKKKINVERCIYEPCNRELTSQYKGRPPLFCKNTTCRVEWGKLHPNELGGAYGWVERNFNK